VALTNVRLGFEGGGTRAEAAGKIPQREKSYPESTMFGTLPAYGFYCRHVRGLRFTNLRLRTDKPDLRHALALDDVQDAEIDGLDASFSPGAAAMVRMANVQTAAIRRCSPTSPVDTLLQLQGKATRRIALDSSDLGKVRNVAAVSPEVPKGALSRK